MDEIAITLDIDWAPDFAIDATAELLSEARVKATWFVTHASPAVDRLRARADLFELGIHPNFLPGTTHGGTPDEILSHCLEIVPDATSLRTHGLAWSSILLERVMERPQLSADVSLFMPMAPELRPVEFWWRKEMLLRIPYYWEDSCEMSKPAASWSLAALRGIGAGLRIFNFHPIHVYLNSNDFERYRAIKAQTGDLKTAGRDLLSKATGQVGARTVFMQLLAQLSGAGGGTTIRDIRRHWSERAAGKAIA